MFKIEKHITLVKDFHKIVFNRLVLFNDGDNDLIFTGTNQYSNRLLCCIMFEDDEEGYIRYIHVLVSEEQYSRFINKKITFRNILDTNKSLFLVDVDYSMNEIDNNLVTIDEIPESYKPLENSYCPDFIYDTTFEYSLSMIGGLADLHKTKANELSNVSTRFSDFLESSTSFLNDFNLGNKAYVYALQTGSFKINFKIEISEPQQSSIVDTPIKKINIFLNNFFKYFFNQLPDEKTDVFHNDVVDSEVFKELENQLKEIYDENCLLPVAGVEQKLIDLINYSAKQLEDIEFDGSFKSLKFENTTELGDSIPVGVFDNSFLDSIKVKLFNVNEYIAEDIIELDEKEKEYKVQIYSFSILTGNGSAFYINEIGEGVSKIAIHAKGRDNYEHTAFTKSMDEGIFVEIKGIGKRVNGKLKSITSEI